MTSYFLFNSLLYCLEIYYFFNQEYENNIISLDQKEEPLFKQYLAGKSKQVCLLCYQSDSKIEAVVKTTVGQKKNQTENTPSTVDLKVQFRCTCQQQISTENEKWLSNQLVLPLNSFLLVTFLLKQEKNKKFHIITSMWKSFYSRKLHLILEELYSHSGAIPLGICRLGECLTNILVVSLKNEATKKASFSLKVERFLR